MLPTIDNRRQTRIETLRFRRNSNDMGSRYGLGGKSRLMRVWSVQADHEEDAAEPYSLRGGSQSTRDHEI